MITIIKSIAILIMLLFFMGFTSCSSRIGIKLPDVEDCMMLSKSVLCVDKRLDNIKINEIVNKIQTLDAIDEDAKLELIRFFRDNQAVIIKNKQFELNFKYLWFFRGYFLTSSSDRFILEKFIDDKFKELETYRQRCGNISQSRMTCR
jgi:hypothetical protein